MVFLPILHSFGTCKYKIIESLKNSYNTGYITSSRNIKETWNLVVRTITYLQSYLVHYFVYGGSQKCSSQTDPKRFKSLCAARLLLRVAKTYCMVLKNAENSRFILLCFCTPDQDAWFFFVCILPVI